LTNWFRTSSLTRLTRRVAADIRSWLEDRLAKLQAEASQRGEPIPTQLPANTLIFDVPDGLVRIFDRDLKAAGIPKRDDRGRTLDVHALRTTFGTLLSRGGVPLRTAQEAMRHSDPKLTAMIYTDPRLLDVHGALDALPGLPLNADPNSDLERQRATGTDAPDRTFVALSVALNHGNEGQPAAIRSNPNTINPRSTESNAIAASLDSDKGKGPLTSPVSDPLEYARQGSNLQPLAPEAAERLQR
jgi:hypothetical protein